MGVRGLILLLKHISGIHREKNGLEYIISLMNDVNLIPDEYSLDNSKTKIDNFQNNSHTNAIRVVRLGLEKQLEVIIDQEFVLAFIHFVQRKRKLVLPLLKLTKDTTMVCC